jgi:hypothetical protein
MSGVGGGTILVDGTATFRAKRLDRLGVNRVHAFYSMRRSSLSSVLIGADMKPVVKSRPTTIANQYTNNANATLTIIDKINGIIIVGLVNYASSIDRETILPKPLGCIVAEANRKPIGDCVVDFMDGMAGQPTTHIKVGLTNLVGIQFNGVHVFYSMNPSSLSS